ncbi:MAG: hypothetical protein EON58_12395 [Alphaproteobacteria bacterium]|nr:MAG: hypothetical protein EON58_12395 [Alphaproteobacteria bacterium]
MLIKLANRLDGRVNALIDEVKPFIGTGDISGGDARRVEHIVMQLQNVWELYMREFVLNSAVGNATDKSGPVKSLLQERIHSKEHASYVLISKYKRRRNEPDWYKPADIADAVVKLNLTNQPKIIGAVGATPWPLDDLRHVRNFIAHRSKRAAEEVRSLPWFGQHDRIDVGSTAFAYLPGGATNIEVWAQQIKDVGSAML